MQFKVDHIISRTLLIRDGASFVKKTKTLAEVELLFIPSPDGKNYLNIGGKWLNPILISRTEKIGVGDLYENDGIVKENSIDADDLPDYWNKVLAMPEHFSHKDIISINRGKLKPGKYFAECESLTLNEDWSKRPVEITNQYHVCHDVILHVIEEQMYTLHEIKEFANHFGINPTAVDEWFTKI